ncbi:MAG: DUF5916 domain-containing protein [Gemmatimonadota bacterium]
MAVSLSGLLLMALAQQASVGKPLTIPASAAEVRAVRLNGAVSVDGVLDEAVWQSAADIGSFTQREPREGAAPTERTVVHLLYDDDAIYIGARLYDSSPDSIVARLARRDHSISSDKFTVFLDPYHDGRSGVYFAVNAAGTLYDGVLYNDDWNDDNWDAVWRAQTRRDSAGWTVEMRIPYSQLRFKRADHQLWGINFERDIARKNETDFLVYTPANGSGFVSRFPSLSGIDNVAPPARLEILPYVTSRAELSNQAAGNPFNDGSQATVSGGADLKFGLGSNLTVDATINPDFGQVEVDPAVVNLSDFETFFPEKRPFFVEGSTIFDFGNGGANNNWGFNWGNPDFFYSRRIGRVPQGSLPSADFSDVPQGTSILGAAKLTGKVGSWNVGMMHALTGREMARVDQLGNRSAIEVEPRTYYGVLRTQKEINDGRQGLGMIATLTARDFRDPRLEDQINGSAYGLAIDGWTFLDRDKTWVITGWGGSSLVHGTAARITSLQQNSLHYFQRPDADYLSLDSGATSLDGFSGRVALNKQKGDWRLNSAVGVISPGFDVMDVGFQSRSDVVNTHSVVTRRWGTPGKTFRFVNQNLAAFASWDFGGELIWAGLYQNGFFQFLNYRSIEYFIAYNPPRLNNRLTRGGPYTKGQPGAEGGVTLRTDDRKTFVYGMGVNASSYKRRSDAGWSINPSIEWKPSTSLTLSFEPGFQRSFTSAHYVGTFADPLATSTFGNRYVFSDLNQTTLSGNIRLNWIFNPKLSLELFAQPLIASGDYYHFKELARPRTYDFNQYGHDASTFDDVNYIADPDGPGPAAPIAVGNPDFNFRSLRGNAVLRWEYMPGSTVFLVWTQSRTADENIGDFRFSHSLSELARAKADNIFAIKVTYWWNP